MKIAIGADHGGFVLKNVIINFLEKKGHKVTDMGAFGSKSCDYPAIGYKVASEVASGRSKRGVLICKSGIGMYMVANKVPGARAALLKDVKSARSSREHNDANIAVFAAAAKGKREAQKLLKIWLSAGFLGGRHARRVDQIKKIEKKVNSHL